jgi:predicted metal-dependent RNase
MKLLTVSKVKNSSSPYYNERVGISLQKDSHGDIVANTLQYYRERTNSSDTSTPKPYEEIKKVLQKTMNEGKRVLIDIKDSYSVQTVVVRFEYVHDRWAMGKSICYLEGQEVEVPYTIHYSDILCKRLKIKTIVEGDNPFGKRP